MDLAEQEDSPAMYRLWTSIDRTVSTTMPSMMEFHRCGHWRLLALTWATERLARSAGSLSGCSWTHGQQIPLAAVCCEKDPDATWKTSSRVSLEDVALASLEVAW